MNAFHIYVYITEKEWWMSVKLIIKIFTFLLLVFVLDIRVLTSHKVIGSFNVLTMLQNTSSVQIKYRKKTAKRESDEITETCTNIKYKKKNNTLLHFCLSVFRFLFIIVTLHISNVHLNKFRFASQRVLFFTA